MSYNLRVKGNITTNVGGSTRIYAKGNVEINSNGSINYSAPEYTYGDPEDPPKKQVIESIFKFESTYIYDHLLSAAKEMFPKFNSDDTTIIYKFYKAIIDGKIVNLPIEVSANLISGKAFYDLDEKKIIIWETALLGIEKNDDKKIKLLQDLTQSYSDYLNDCLKEISIQDGFESYDYDMFRFDAMGTETIIIGKLEMPTYKGSLELSFPETESKPFKSNQWRPETKKGEHGPNAGNFENYDQGPGDPPVKNPNIGIKFAYSLNGGFTVSIYAGISKEIARAGDMHLMPSMNAALTYFGNGAPGTSPLSKQLFNATLTPAVTIGCKTANALNMNLFTSFTGSGVYVPYEYAFTAGTTGVLSSGKVTSEYNADGKRQTDKYNSFDNRNRNQIVGGASIKIGNFMISSFNDISQPPLFFGMGSDQYWSAGVNMQAKITDQISMGYAFDLYYGKSNHLNPYNWDKWINYQNYDHQRFYDLLLNRGQETFSFTDANGNLNTTTKFGYGTFWPSNQMHNTIEFPEFPKKPKEPIKDDYTSDKKFDEDYAKYKNYMLKYNNDKKNYEISISLKQYPTFHHLFVVYKNGSNKIDWNRVRTYLDAGLTTEPIESPILKKFYLLDEENKKK